VTLRVIPRPVNRRPTLVIQGNPAVAAGELCSLSVTANDSDAGQTLSISVKNEPLDASFAPPVFTWRTAPEHVGSRVIAFIVRDNGLPALSDTQKVTLVVLDPLDSVNKPPKWENDTITQKTWPGSAIALTLTDKCADPRGDSLVFSLLPGGPAGDTVLGARWTFTPGDGDTGTLFPRILARDPQGLADTATIRLVAQRLDTVGPGMKPFTPAKDSIGVNSSGIALTILCTDGSGVAGVSCSMGNDTFHVASNDSLFTAMVTGLKPNRTNIVAFIAADGSPRANKDTLLFRITYDSTLADNLPPAARLLSPAGDTVINADSCRVRFISSDASGISSATCVIANNSFSATRSSPSDSVFTAMIRGLAGGLYTPVRISVVDASPAFNKCSLTVRIKYDNDTARPGVRLLTPAKDSAAVAGSATTIVVVCRDKSGVASVRGVIGSDSFAGVRSASADSVWSLGITGLAADRFTTVAVIAADSSLKANADTVLVHIKYDADTVAPFMRLVAPAKDSSGVNADFCSIKIACGDASGITGMSCLANAVSLPVAHNPGDSIWEANATNLAANQFTTILFIATDASARANKDTLSVSVKYDPAMIDSAGPIFLRKSGPISGAVIAGPVVTIVDSIVDPSGVDSVFWTLNGIVAGALLPDAAGVYTLVDTLFRTHLDTIVIFAQDKSALRNKNSSTVVLDYNIPPRIADTSVATNRNSAVSWTLNAVSGDGDALLWSVITAPLPAHGALSGVLPGVTFTPASNWAGLDSFTVRVTDGVWSDTATVKLTVADVLVAPKDVRIVSQPASDTLILGQGITFSVALNSDVNPAPSYQWNHNGAAIAGATASTYSISGAALKDTGSYSISATNSAGSATSPAVTLVILVPPSISGQPAGLTACSGGTASFTVTASGTPPFTYQWKKDGATVGTNSPTYSITPVSSSHVGVYTCVVANICGAGAAATSQAATLTVNTAATITGNPASQTKWAGDSVIFTAAASGTAPLSYKWRKGTSYNGATSPSCTVAVAAADNGAAFSCVVSNGCGKDTSGAATLTVKAVKAVGGTYSAGLFIRTDNTLWSCGYNSYGQLGTGDTIDRKTPVQITSVTNALDVACGYIHTIVLRSDGTVWGCGYNKNGQLGVGDTSRRTSLSQVSISGVTAIAAGGHSSYFLKSDGTLLGCGLNSYGQLADDTATLFKSPRTIATNVLKVAAGFQFTLIVKRDSTVWACGENGSGQLGLGDYESRSSFVQIPGITKVADIAAGYGHSLIVKSDGTLLVCGYNNYGQLGNGTTVNNPTPTALMTGVAGVGSGRSHSTILKKDGTVWACGYNSSGQCGIGSTASPQSTPVQMGVVTGGAAVGTNHGYQSHIIKSDGSLWACGQDGYGQLGDGQTANRSTPARVTW
jgi:alpha-tubulin suppressor-like RCC1 family protein